jgi:hypothetical protein
MSKFILKILTLIVISSAGIYCQLLERVVISPLNRATFYFNEIPQFTAILSDDKQSLNLNLDNSNFKNTITDVESKGVITKISSTKSNDKINAFITLAEKRGYNAYTLPYSKAVVIEFFKWDKLSQAEETYRTALLSLESNQEELALTDLENAAKQNEPNALAMLGIIQFKKGDVKLAFENLAKSENLGSSIPDIYAALTEYYLKNSDSSKAKEYNKKFFDKTTINLYPELDKTQIQKQDTSKTQTPSLAKEDNSILPNITFDKVVSSLGYFLFAVGLLIIYYYLRWRNKQAAKLKTVKPKQAVRDVPPTKPQARNKQKMYAEEETEDVPKHRTNPGLINKAYGKLKPNKENQFTKNSLMITPKPREVKPNVVAEESNIQLEQFLKDYIPQKRKEEEELAKETVMKVLEKAVIKPGQSDSKNIPNKAKGIEKAIAEKQLKKANNKEQTTKLKEEVIPIKEEKVTEKLPIDSTDANISFAKHLAEKQKEIKTKDIEAIQSENLPQDKDKLINVAKEMGLDTTTLELKKDIDQERLSKLNEKFNK